MMGKEEKDTQKPDHDGLELDRLELPDRPAENPTPETSPPATGSDNSSNAEASPSQPSAWRKGLGRTVLTKAFLIPFFMALVISVLIWILPVERFFRADLPSTVTPLGRVVYDVSSYLGYQHTVTFRLSASYTQLEEKARLQEELPTLKTIITNAGHLPEFRDAIEEKDLNALEKAILQLIRDVTELPLDRFTISRLQLD